MLKEVERERPALQRQVGPIALLFTGIIGSGCLFASLYAAQLAGPAAISFLGNYGGGVGVIPKYVDLLVVSAFSLFVFWVAVRTRLTDAETAELVRTAA